MFQLQQPLRKTLLQPHSLLYSAAAVRGYVKRFFGHLIKPISLKKNSKKHSLLRFGSCTATMLKEKFKNPHAFSPTQVSVFLFCFPLSPQSPDKPSPLLLPISTLLNHVSWLPPSLLKSLETEGQLPSITTLVLH